ncbi:LysR family transcriptional regulator [Vibrio maerlii]|uniref:LysR family transcriptional regulator n=1 Tax=Vibrio maerlii TaxID=2231648 RepID=UPI000E3DD800|nr:LysR family transcriptional regulator [Vibrio maerlii]
MLGNINLNLLRSLHVLLEECHVSRAAERLNITQSAVSRQLAQLRELTGDPLLVRDRNNLVPTSRALVLQNKLGILAIEFDDLFSDKPFEPLEWHGELTLSSSDYVAQYIVPDIAQHLSQTAPNLNLAYQLWHPDFLDKLADTPIQLASSMLPDKPKELSSKKLGEDYAVCLMRKDHPLTHKPDLSIDDLVRFNHVKVTGGGDKDSFVDIALRERGRSRRVSLKVPFFSSAINRLLNSDLLMIVPEHIAHNLSKHHALTYKALPFDTPAHMYWLMWHPKYDLDPAHAWVREEVYAIMRVSKHSIGMISDHYNDE